MRVAGLLVVAALLAACGGGPRPLTAGDPCARCHMPVADARYGAQLVTRTGLARSYDAIECLALDVLDEVVPRADIATLWVTPADAPGTLIRAEDAIFVQSGSMRSPMGSGLTAYASADAAAPATSQGGRILTWQGVLGFLRQDDSPHAHVHEALR